ncbi:MAG: PAS domain-containing protein [Pseudomonadota bacterium]
MARGAEIIQLFAARASRDDPALRDVERYWNQLRRDRLTPARAEVEPRGLGSALDRAFILERIAPGLARFRVAGRQLVNAMGIEVSGLPLTVCFQAPERDRLSDALEQVFAAPATLRLSLLSPPGIGRPPFGGQMLILPLHDDLGGRSRALGCFVTTGTPGRAPRRFVIKGCVARDVEASAPNPESPTRLPSPEDTPA